MLLKRCSQQVAGEERLVTPSCRPTVPRPSRVVSCQASRQPVGSSSSSSFVGAAPVTDVSRKSACVSRVSSRSYKRLVTRNCGIIGIHRTEGNCSVELYEGLLMLQHRGQDSAGMVTYGNDKFREYKENGLVKDVFSDSRIMDTMVGNVGLAHVRYPTAGSASAQEAQPFFVNSPLGIYLIHNGNLTNADEMRELLNGSRSFFNRHLRTDSDSEVLLNVFADEVHRAHQRCLQSSFCDVNANKTDFVLEAAQALMRLLKGSYSCISIIRGVGLVGFRDPKGIRPLVIGKRTGPNGGDEWCFSSEDSAFGPIGFTLVRDVNPGEIVVITPEGELISRQCVPGELNPCIFEYIYLARPDSTINEIPVYNFQLELGRCLARRIREKNWDLDIVCPVPDGSRPAAIEIASELNLPYREGLVKNRYVGRTFIMPDQRLREMSVRRKLNAMSVVFKDQNVLLVDDSIVRGTTMGQIVEMVRRAGAKKVYLASASPPVIFPNVYGVDMPSRKEFVANGLTVDEICNVLGADGLIYQEVSDLLETGMRMNPKIKRFDASCFDGHYVTGDIDEAYLAKLEASGRSQGKNRSGAGKAAEAAAAVVRSNNASAASAAAAAAAAAAVPAPAAAAV